MKKPRLHRLSQALAREPEKLSILVLRVTLERGGEEIIEQYEAAVVDPRLAGELKVTLERIGKG